MRSLRLEGWHRRRKSRAVLCVSYGCTSQPRRGSYKPLSLLRSTSTAPPRPPVTRTQTPRGVRQSAPGDFAQHSPTRSTSVPEHASARVSTRQTETATATATTKTETETATRQQQWGWFRRRKEVAGRLRGGEGKVGGEGERLHEGREGKREGEGV